MSKIKKAIDFIFAGEEHFTLENRLFLSAIIVGMLTSLIGALVNFIFATSMVAVIIPLVLSVFLSAIYYVIRFKGVIEPLKFPIIVIAIIGISITWVFNGGINGSNVMPGFVILILSLVIVPDRKKKYILLLFLILNVIIYLIQLLKPTLIVNYISETERWSDSIITLFYTSYFIFLILKFLHSHYTLERLKAEESEKMHRLSEANLEEAQKIAHVGSWEWDMDSKAMIWSKEMYRVFGIHENEFDGKPSSLLKVIHPDDILSFANSMNSNLPNGKSTSVEYRVIHKDGSIHNVFAEGRVECNDDGSPYRSVGTVQDITNMKLSEQLIIKSKERYKTLSNQLEAILDHIPGLIYYKDTKNNFIRVNKYLAHEHGVEKALLEGKSLYDLYPVEDADKYYQDDLIVINSGTAILNIEEHWETTTGEKWVSTSKIPFIDNDGEIRGVIGISMDITGRKRFEKQILLDNEILEKLIAEKDKFFSIIAHDLRTPFASLVGLSELMANEHSQYSVEDFQQYARSLHKTTIATFNLLENLLEWAHLQRGTMPFNPESIDLKTFFDHCDESIGEMAGKKSIQLKISLAPEGLVVVADTNMLRSIMRNLVLNAIKFTNSGGTVIVKAQKDQSDNILFSVTDTGIGMPHHLLKNLFKIDTNVSRPGTNGEHSTGLGLILCNEFIEKHGGRIWVESIEGEGSTFYFTLTSLNSK